MADDFDEDDEGTKDERKGGEVVRFPSKLNGGTIRPRHDGFTAAKQRKFFKTLKKSGCITDACRVAGISTTTVARWRDKDEVFDDKVEQACAIASVELDMIAWKRATEGAEEKVYRNGKLVYTRVKPSDAMLRLLMQGANPRKYGRTGQVPPPKNKHLLKKLKQQAEREVRAAYSEGNRAHLVEKLTALIGMKVREREREQRAAGWTPGPDGTLVVPPGWRIVPAVPLLPPPAGP